MKHSQKEIENIIFIKIGNNYRALIFNFLWFFYHKMFAIGFILFLIYFYSFWINIFVFLLIYTSISVLLFLFGNNILVKHLIYIENCKFLGISDGKNIKEARKLFLKEFEKENK